MDDININDDIKAGAATSLQRNHAGLRGQYIYQKGLLNEVILTILNQSSNRPIRERADSTLVRGYMRTELESNGLDLPLEFAIVNRAGHTVYRTDRFTPPENDEKGSVYDQALFPNDHR